MNRDTRTFVACLALAGCAGEGTWTVETWGEEYIEREIPADVFEDGCSVDYAEFVVSIASLELVDGDGAVVGDLGGAKVYDLTVPGPSAMGEATVPADHYSSVRLVIEPADADPGTASAAQVAALADAGASVLVDGTLTCPGGSAHLRWTFDERTTYACEPPDLTIPAEGEDGTQITIHGDHLF